MGTNAIIRREMLRAKAYMAEWDRYAKLKASKTPPANLLPPRKDLRLEVLSDLLRGRMVARVHDYQATEALEFIGIAKEFGFKVQCLEHAWEAYKIADELAAAKIGISVFADSWAYKMEAAEGIAYTAGYCAKKGVLVSINSDSGERIRRLFNDAAKSMKYGGLDETEALSLVTINPGHPARRGQDRRQPRSRQAGRHRHLQRAPDERLHPLRHDDHRGRGLFRPRPDPERPGGGREKGPAGAGQERGRSAMTRRIGLSVLIVALAAGLAAGPARNRPRSSPSRTP